MIVKLLNPDKLLNHSRKLMKLLNQKRNLLKLLEKLEIKTTYSRPKSLASLALLLETEGRSKFGIKTCLHFDIPEDMIVTAAEKILRID
jgi:hypothetical protein